MRADGRMGRRIATRELQAPGAALRWLPRRDVLVELALVALALALTGWLTINVWHTGDYDVFEYQHYAQAFWAGQPRFSAFPTEYPPLALLPFSLTLLPGFADPRVSFALGLSVLFLAGYAGVWRLVGRGSARLYAVYLLVALQSTLVARYDLVPALAALAALLATRRRHFALAYVLLALGTLLKVYPVVVLPVVVIEQVRSQQMAATAPAGDSAQERQSLQAAPSVPRRFTAGWATRVLRPFMVGIAWQRARPALLGAGGCLALITAGFLLPWLRNPSGALSFLSYATNRPIQVESFPATLLWLGTFLGFPAQHAYSFGSDTYLGPLSVGVSVVLTVALVAGCLATYALQLVGRIPFERAMLVCVAIVLLASRVFSTQYMTWVLPLAAVAGGDTLAWGAICLLTFMDYPGLYPFNHPPYTAWDEFTWMAVVAARNLLMLGVAVRALLGFERKAGYR